MILCQFFSYQMHQLMFSDHSGQTLFLSLLHNEKKWFLSHQRKQLLTKQQGETKCVTVRTSGEGRSSYPSFLDGFPQQTHHVPALHSTRLEALGPGHQETLQRSKDGNKGVRTSWCY